MSYIAKISLPGYDVGTATPEQCAIHSGYPPFHSKIGQSPAHSATLIVDFTSGIPQSSTRTLYSIPHGYTYIPTVLASIKVSGLSILDLYGINYTGVGATLSFEVKCNATDMTVTVFDSANWITSSTELQVSYYIFAENGT